MRRKLVAGNWKMHGSAVQNAQLVQTLVAAAHGLECELAVFPPFPYLAQVAELLADSAVLLGAQDVSEHQAGAYTGEVSAGMLRDLQCRLVLVGHSERRTLHAESDACVAAKFRAAQSQGLTPVFCFGETQLEREQGVTEAVIARQVGAVIDHVGVAAFASAILAYEPVWAIGTGINATPEQAQEVHVLVRMLIERLDPVVAAGVRILYGGSVKPQNAAVLFAQPDIDGGLIGGASLVVEDFLAICSAAT